MKDISQIGFCLRLKILLKLKFIPLFTCKLPIPDLDSQWLTKEHVTRVILRMKKFSERCSG